MQNLNIKYIVVNGSSETADHTIQTADYRWQTTDIGSSKTAAPYNETIRLTQGDNMINVRQIFLKL